MLLRSCAGFYDAVPAGITVGEAEGAGKEKAIGVGW